MAIEGPLRELGIHDVFQLLDLSRKTGVLRVMSELRDDEGHVLFDGGRVIHASIRSNPTSIERILREAGRLTDAELAAVQGNDRSVPLGDRLVFANVITQRELERHLRLAIESVVFELMSWREGFFSFEERSVSDAPVDARVRVATESLLMEGARRIDEWSRIADRVPSLSVVPMLAPADDDRSSAVDLLPHEWEVLMTIDGERDLREIARALGRSEFDVAKIAYGLLCTGVVGLRPTDRSTLRRAAVQENAESELVKARTALEARRYDDAVTYARAAASGGMDTTEARLIVARALMNQSKFQEAVQELRRAVQDDPITPEVHLQLGFAAVRTGDFANARASWEHFVRLSPTSPEVPRVSAALELITRLTYVLEAHAGG